MFTQAKDPVLWVLVVALLVAVVAYAIPVGQALLAGTQGAAFGLFPILSSCCRRSGASD